MGKKKDEKDAKETLEAMAKTASQGKKERENNHKKPETYRDKRGRLGLRRIQ